MRNIRARSYDGNVKVVNEVAVKVIAVVQLWALCRLLRVNCEMKR